MSDGERGGMNRRDFVRTSALGLAAAAAGIDRAHASPAFLQTSRTEVPDAVMKQVYESVKTPFKYGVVLAPDGNQWIDIPCVFRHRNRWYMLYLNWDATTRRGYETTLASSPDLIRWTPAGTPLPFRSGQWDSSQAAGSIALMNNGWGESPTLRRHDGKYWISYLGGDVSGYETGALGIGMAHTDDPATTAAWQRFDAPVLGPKDGDTRWWEKQKLYRSNVIHDPQQRLGAPYVMYYNAADEKSVERIGIAISSDMVRWTRYRTEPVIDNRAGISGDPQVVRMGDLFVMFYFGAFWKPGAFDTFACSYDLVNWTRWTGPDLVAPSMSYDAQYAHKPWVIKHDGVVYHFYNAASRSGRRIALATSVDLGTSTLVPAPAWRAGRIGNAVSLCAAPHVSFVTLPTGIVQDRANLTICTWIRPARLQERARIFDFGSSPDVRMYLALAAGGAPRFAITTGGAAGEQQLTSVAPLTTAWHHVAVTLEGASCTLYIDGAASATSADITLDPSDLGATANNWIGRSQSARDPFLDALVDDFQIYDRALTPDQVRALADGQPGAGNVASYRFDEDGGSMAADSSGNARHAQVVADW